MNEDDTQKKDVFYRRLFVQAYGVLLTLLAFGFVSYAAFAHDYAANPDSVRIIDTILGVILGSILTSVVGYFFGSSQGSVDKAEQIERLVGQKPEK